LNAVLVSHFCKGKLLPNLSLYKDYFEDLSNPEIFLGGPDGFTSGLFGAKEKATVNRYMRGPIKVACLVKA